MRFSSQTTTAAAVRSVGLSGAALLLLAGCGASEREAVTLDGPPRASSVAPSRPTCLAGAVERRPLVLREGLEAYVEPTDLIRVGEDVVVVGSPTYTWELGGDTVRMASERAHIAAYLDEDPPRLVPNPFGTDIGAVRSVALGGRRWGALVEKRAEDANGSTRPTGLRYAEYDGEGWSELETLPLPGDGVFPGTSSALVLHGDELVWAVLDDRGGGSVYEYRRRGGAWSYEQIQDRGLEAAALGVGASGLWLAIKGLDPGVEGPRKSVRIYRWEAGWRLVVRDPTPETYTEIGNPELMVLPGGAAVTWIEHSGDGVAKARIGVGPDSPGSLLVLDESAPVVRSFATDSGEPAWILQHVEPSRHAAELRVLLAEGGRRVRVVQSMPLPYTGFFDALAAGPGAVLVTGAEFSPDPARATVRSLTLRLSLSCR